MKDAVLLRALSLLLLVIMPSLAWSVDDSNRDPWEYYNRKVFAFNDGADRYILAPVARSYQWVTPDPVESGVRNFFSNIDDIMVIANDLLQLKFAQAGSDTGRFLINSTLGVVGFFDVASKVGLEKHRQDFGMTFAHWGAESGPFVMMPLLGPFTVRDGMGAVVASFADVITTQVNHVPTRNALIGTELIDRRASLLAAEGLISGDRYTFLRDIYLQQRDFLTNGATVVEDSFGDENFEDFDGWDEED